jgi:superfamily II DNA or RNA helicase
VTAPYYRRTDRAFSLFTTPTNPQWRRPQFGAIGALLAHLALHDRQPALISLPTGAGKTGVALAVSQIVSPRRILVVVPTADLRAQAAEAFRSQELLRRIGALTGKASPLVVVLRGRVEKWAAVRKADVVVSLPNSISPRYYTNGAVPRDLFDLVIVDEAHHAPAPTWRAVLEHFAPEQALLLTATPRRRDGQQLPGVHVFHYPVRQAIAEGIYKPIRPIIRKLPPGTSRTRADELIAAEVVAIASQAEHASSAVLIRASSIGRAEALKSLYDSLGMPVAVLHSKLKETVRDAVVTDLKSGHVRAVAVVEMLGEGFDLPRLRIAAYHDKHKSVLPTVQLLGRLVRADPAFPQESVLVTARDIDTYPQLQGAARALYQEDSDWAEILPGLIDDVVAEDRLDREYARQLVVPPAAISADSLTPLCREVVYEVDSSDGWKPELLRGKIPPELSVGKRIHGEAILYSAIVPSKMTLVLITTVVERPRWHEQHAGLDTARYNLHLVTWRSARETGQPSLLLVNTNDGSIERALVDVVAVGAQLRSGDPRALQESFDVLQRVSVSSIGVRNTYHSAPGVPKYATFEGSGVDRGLRDVDTAHRALGHAMAQVNVGGGTHSAGIATGKAKYWEARYVSLRLYEDFVTEFAQRYWYPPTAGTLRLVPSLNRSRRVDQFPTGGVAAVEWNPALIGADWSLHSLSLEDVELRYAASSSNRLRIAFVAVNPVTGKTIWQGAQDLRGRVHDDGKSLMVTRGFSTPAPLSELLSDHPPTFFFLDGQTLVGSTIVDSREYRGALPNISQTVRDWTGVDMRAESRRIAAKRKQGISIHESLESHLSAAPKRRKRRWIICNDGPREIADYLVIEMDDWQHVDLSLWHAKAAAGSAPAVRIDDFQEVVAQAIKARRYMTDRSFWRTLGLRLDGHDAPTAIVVEGNTRLLRTLCGRNEAHQAWSISERAPKVTGHIGIAQPGLSWSALKLSLAGSAPSLSAKQIRELLTVLHDSVAYVSDVTVLGSV